MTNTKRAADQKSHIILRPYRGSDAPALLSCWERALPYDAISHQQLEGRVLLDDNFERGSLTVATIDAEIVGFVACFVLNRPIEKVGHRPTDGFIQAMGVAPEYRGRGVGEALLKYAEQFFRDRGRTQVLLAPYTPNYFVPGVDKDRYAEGLAWLQKQGFVEYSEALAADALIGTFALPEKTLQREADFAAEGITVRPLQREDFTAYMEFMRAIMPGPWVEDSRRILRQVVAGNVSEDAIWLAVDTSFNADKEGHTSDGRIIGFCQHEGEHFGPFGVSDDYQGRGVGTVLLARTLHCMRIKGCHSAWVLWTGQRALDGVYGRLGFKLSRRFAILKKVLPA